MILVTGATGRIGRLVVDELLRAGAPVRALTRTPAEASLPPHVDVVAGDLTDPVSLDAALTGASAVFLVWTAPLESAPPAITRIAQHARRVVFLSAPIHTPHPFFQQPNPMCDLHVAVEQLLQESALEVAVVRPGMFVSNALHWWAPQIRVGNVVRWPYAQAASAPIDERDVATVAARMLVDERHARSDYVITGPQSMTQAQQVAAIGSAIGRALRYDELTPDEFRRDTKDTWPPGVADMLLAAWHASVGLPAFTTFHVEHILGRPAISFEAWAAEHAAAFQG